LRNQGFRNTTNQASIAAIFQFAMVTIEVADAKVSGAALKYADAKGDSWR
jgi:hypothetical protein